MHFVCEIRFQRVKCLRVSGDLFHFTSSTARYFTMFDRILFHILRSKIFHYMHLWAQMQCLSRKEDRECEKTFSVLFLSVGNISVKPKTVLKDTDLLKRSRFLTRQSRTSSHSDFIHRRWISSAFGRFHPSKTEFWWSFRYRESEVARIGSQWSLC